MIETERIILSKHFSPNTVKTCHRWWRGDLNFLNLCFICSPHSSNHHDLDTTLCCLVWHLFLVTIVCDSWSPGVSGDQVRDAVTFYDWPSPTSATWAPGVFATNYNTFARLAAPSNLSVHKIKYWSIQQIQLQLYGLGRRLKHGLEMEHRVLQL